jgi:hypothetical protein
MIWEPSPYSELPYSELFFKSFFRVSARMCFLSQILQSSTIFESLADSYGEANEGGLVTSISFNLIQSTGLSDLLVKLVQLLGSTELNLVQDFWQEIPVHS